jgi:hypothetical protein
MALAIEIVEREFADPLTDIRSDNLVGTERVDHEQGQQNQQQLRGSASHDGTPWRLAKGK